MRRLRRGSVVARANRLVPITAVLDQIGIDSPGLPGVGVSIKVLCPFQDIHPADRAGEKDMRLYSDNKVYCHMCAEGWDVVSLAARLWSSSPAVVARQLLAAQGLEVSEEDADPAARFVPSSARSSAVAALAMWADARGVDRYSSEYSRCLTAADQIARPEHVAQWLTACKAFLEGSRRA